MVCYPIECIFVCKCIIDQKFMQYDQCAAKVVKISRKYPIFALINHF